MMLKYAFGLSKESNAIEQAIMAVLEDGYRTGDIASATTPKDKTLSTSGMGNKVAEYLNM